MEANSWKYQPVPPSAIRLFRMSWQLETWLRLIVYVEFRAAVCNWEVYIESFFNPKRLKSDKSLHHMATPHGSKLLYLTLNDLWKLVSANENWNFFEHYFPPKDNLIPRIEEILAIRNRVAHSREPHENDVARMRLFLRDLESGFRNFCARYSNTEPVVREDGVAERLQEEWPRIGHCTELFVPAVGWLYAPEPFTTSPKLGGKLERLTHPSREGSNLGLIYRLTVLGVKGWQLDIRKYVETSQHLSDKIIHWMVPEEDIALVTIPAVLGEETVYEIVHDLLHIALNSVVLGDVPSYRRWTKKKQWPEHVLLPNHHLMVARLNLEIGLDENLPVFDLN